MQRAHYTAYAVLAVPLAFLGLPLYVYVPSLYAELPAIGLGLAGGVLFAARLIDLLTDPAVGFLGDRFRVRLHPLGWILLGVPVIGVGVYTLFNPPAEAGVMYLAISVSITYLGWTLLNVPYYAWGAELAQTSASQRRLSAWREAAVLCGALTALLIAALASAEPMRAMSLAFLLLLLVGVASLLFLPRASVSRPRSHVSIGDIWRHTGQGMRRLLGLHFLNALAAGMPATLFLMYTQGVLGASPQTSGVLLLIYFIAGVLALPLWVRVAAQLGDVRAWQLAIGLAALGFLPAAFLGEGDVWIFAIVCLVTGATLGADIALPAAIQARLANVDSADAGHPRQSASFGLWGMAGKLALACAVGLTFPLLDLLPVDASRDAALPWLYAMAPVLVKLMTLIGVELARPCLPATSERPLVEEEVDEHESMVDGRPDGVAAERV